MAKKKVALTLRTYKDKHDDTLRILASSSKITYRRLLHMENRQVSYAVPKELLECYAVSCPGWMRYILALRLIRKDCLYSYVEVSRNHIGFMNDRL